MPTPTKHTWRGELHKVRAGKLLYAYQNVNVIPPAELALDASDKFTLIRLSLEPSHPIGINPSSPELVRTVDAALFTLTLG